jgi:hypothetical protein
LRDRRGGVGFTEPTGLMPRKAMDDALVAAMPLWALVVWGVAGSL